jgi:urease accessory protein
VDGAPFLAGLIQPVLNPLHLLAMLIVGVLAAVSGGVARWACPAVSVGATALGGSIGHAPPLIDPMTVAVALMLAAALSMLSMPNCLLGTTCAIGLLGAAHGYTQRFDGRETGGLAFGAGTLSAIFLLQSAGILLGFALGPQRPPVIRGLALITCLVGSIIVF